MTVLQAHKFYWHRDGASNYALGLSRLLEGEGHSVVPFATVQKENLSSKYTDYFVSAVPIDNPKGLSFGRKLQAAKQVIYSRAAKKKMSQLLATHHIDVAHIHNIYHHLSPSILIPLKKKGIPIVMTLHDSKLICPNYLMFHHGKVHEEDCRGWYGSCVKNKCIGDSRAASMLAQAEMVWHHKIMRYYRRYVDKFIVPSEFLIDLCVKYGWPAERFEHVPHPIDASEVQSVRPESFVLFSGRLSEEKGIRVLLDAAQRTPDIPYILAGEGPMRKEIEHMIKKKKLTNVQCVGFQSQKQMQQLVASARLLVLPSICNENYPLSVLEAKAVGTIAVGSCVGGVPELLPSDLLFEPGNATSLSEVVSKWCFASASSRLAMAKMLRAQAQHVNDPTVHISKILSIYESIC